MSVYIIYSLIQFLSISKSTNLPFSWNTIPTFAFPGAHDGFLTAEEVNKYSLDFFPQILIWGFNASCQNPNNGDIYPAKTSGSFYSCGANHTFYANMEQSLQYEAYDMKKNLIKNKNVKIFGYIESTNVQESYVYQHIFNSNVSPYDTYHLKLQNKGVINCYLDGCNWQGPTYHQYDHRQQAVRDYFVNSVVYNLVNNTYLDGIFIDSISTWMVTLCPEWNCTEIEYNDLYNGSLAVASQTVDLLNKFNKIGTISAHVDIYHFNDYYWKYREILNKYNGDNTIRFYECIEAYYWGSSFYNHFVTLLNETYSNTATHVHACSKTMNPSWVELAAFLIAVNNQSWFSYSQGWTVDGGWYDPIFNKSLGEPLNDAKCINDNQWHIFNGINMLAYSDAIPAGNSSDGTIIYIGIFDTYQECFDAVKINNAFGSFNWVNQHGGNWKNMCFGKFGGSWMNYPQSNTVSGHLGNLYCTRDFEHVSVEFDILNEAANITWN